MLTTIRNAMKVPELRRKIFFTLAMLFIYRIGCWIPVPGIDAAAMEEIVAGNQLFELLNMISGGSFANFTFFALGISPYITASIIMQLLTVAIPKLGKMVKEDEDGRRKFNRYTRYAAIGLALVESIGFIVTLSDKGLIAASSKNFFMYTLITLVVTGGCTLCMWIGERITQRGVGNGISLIIFIGIVARMPNYGVTLFNTWRNNLWVLVIIAAAFLGMIAVITWVDLGQRRIPVQYAKQQRGRKLYGGQSTHLPIKVNSASVLPIIFALSFLQVPQLIGSWFPESGYTAFIGKYLSGQGTYMWIYLLLYMLFIFGFTFFYNSITVDSKEIADNLQHNGGFIQGIRPGKNTREYISKVSNRLTFFCALFLTVIAVIPLVFSRETGIAQIFSASSILIMVSVALETNKQIESQLLVRNYRGFLG